MPCRSLHVDLRGSLVPLQLQLPCIMHRKRLEYPLTIVSFRMSGQSTHGRFLLGLHGCNIFFLVVSIGVCMGMLTRK